MKRNRTYVELTGCAKMLHFSQNFLVTPTSNNEQAFVCNNHAAIFRVTDSSNHPENKSPLSAQLI
jgi:hypothetical protein